MGQLQVGIEFQSEPVISVSGPAGAKCEVQWSDTLTASSQWFFLTNGVLANMLQTPDANAGAEPRFYRAVLVPQTDMVLIPDGSFAMGDTFSEGFTNERPVHDVLVSGFFMDRYEVTRFKWDTVKSWADTNGYAFDHDGGGKGGSHPVHTVNWYDVVKWCNARSEMEGRSPVYFTSAGQTNVYRAGQINLSNECVRWSANGYRLPTEAEWEKAARGGQSDSRFPWGDTISHSNANYFATASFSYDVATVKDFHPAYAIGDFPYTSPVGSFPANAYGLHDVAGNVWEWCWDAFDPAWYPNPLALEQDTLGPDGISTNRVLRGGSWIDDASFCRSANRMYNPFQAATSAGDALGFRCAISLVPPSQPAVLSNAALLAGGAFRFTISNLTPGKTTFVALSTNLVNWTPIWTNVPTAASLEFTNAPASQVGNAFYRTWQLP